MSRERQLRSYARPQPWLTWSRRGLCGALCTLAVAVTPLARAQSFEVRNHSRLETRVLEAERKLHPTTLAQLQEELAQHGKHAILGRGFEPWKPASAQDELREVLRFLYRSRCDQCMPRGAPDIWIRDPLFEATVFGPSALGFRNFGPRLKPDRATFIIDGSEDEPALDLPELEEQARIAWADWSTAVPTLARNAVVKLEFEPSVNAPLCTGTLIASNFVLSAAHCVPSLPRAVSVGADVHHPREYEVARCIALPRGVDSCEQAYASCETEPSRDLVLLELSAAVGPELAQPVAVLQAVPDADLTSEYVRLVGYGADVVVYGSAARYPDLRQQALGYVRDQAPRFHAVREPLLFSIESASSAYLGPGDSGGPVLMRTQEERSEVLVGVATRSDGVDQTALAVQLWQRDVLTWLNTHVSELQHRERRIQKRIVPSIR